MQLMSCHSQANMVLSAGRIHVDMNWLTFITDADGSVLGDPAGNTSP